MADRRHLLAVALAVSAIESSPFVAGDLPPIDRSPRTMTPKQRATRRRSKAARKARKKGGGNG